MERTINSLIGCRMEARDGDVGRVHDVYFDDESWTLRYLVLKTDDWLSGRKVLIAPVALLEDGGQSDYLFTDARFRFAPIKVDGRLKVFTCI